MLGHIAVRLAQALVVMLVMSVLVFVGVYAIGNPIDVLIGPDVSQELRLQTIAQYGLDRPLWEQYFTFLGRVLHGDFGRSFVFGMPVLELILQRLPATLELAVAALVIAVVLGVPLGVLGAVIFTSLRGLDNDVYFQVGLLTTVGLASKNAILIVEFATQLQAQGKALFEATLEAVRLRLRPIIMTSLAFGVGVLPLAMATGAGSAGRHSIGTAVLGGTVFSTVLGLFFVPVFFLLVRSWFKDKQAKSGGQGVDQAPGAAQGEVHA